MSAVIVMRYLSFDGSLAGKEETHRQTRSNSSGVSARLSASAGQMSSGTSGTFGFVPLTIDARIRELRNLAASLVPDDGACVGTQGKLSQRKLSQTSAMNVGAL